MTTSKPEYKFTVDDEGATLRWQGETFTLEPADLRNGGWILKEDAAEHCGCNVDSAVDEAFREGRQEVEAELGDPREVLKRWHDDQGHHGALRHCYEEPCKAVAEALGAWGG